MMIKLTMLDGKNGVPIYLEAGAIVSITEVHSEVFAELNALILTSTGVTYEAQERVSEILAQLAGETVDAGSDDFFSAGGEPSKKEWQWRWLKPDDLQRFRMGLGDPIAVQIHESRGHMLFTQKMPLGDAIEWSTYEPEPGPGFAASTMNLKASIAAWRPLL